MVRGRWVFGRTMGRAGGATADDPAVVGSSTAIDDAGTDGAAAGAGSGSGMARGSPAFADAAAAVGSGVATTA